MALTYSRIGKADSIGRLKVVPVDVTFDSSYPTGGEAFGGGLLNIAAAKVVGVEVIGSDAESTAYVFRYQTATRKLLAYTGALAQVADTTDLSTLTIRVLVWHT